MLLHSFFLCRYGDHRDLHSFPTRRSSDLRRSASAFAPPGAPAFARRNWLALASSAPIRADSRRDRKSTRLNSSHVEISYAVFCLKKKKNIEQQLEFHSKRNYGLLAMDAGA